ncbi:MAG TPA: Nif11-like leader peptide family natural product precursor [Pyrinomonadaceae bacterium]|nr:Nif11-like leader peptide family natural product precursor [Pyrinomonadaceae bacterium]
MSENNFEEFRRLVLTDDSLQKALRDIADRSEFVTRMVELGTERGYQFSSQDVEDALRSTHRIGM